MEVKEPTHMVIIKGVACLGALMGSLGLASIGNNQDRADARIGTAKKALIIDYGLDSATIGETETKFFTPNKNVAIVKRLERMTDSLDIKAKHPSWDTAKITSSLSCLRK